MKKERKHIHTVARKKEDIKYAYASISCPWPPFSVEGVAQWS